MRRRNPNMNRTNGRVIPNGKEFDKKQKRVLNCYVIYVSERWTILPGMRKEIEATKICFCRHILRIPWNGASKQRVNFQENRNKTNTYAQNQVTVEIIWLHRRERVFLEILTLTSHTERETAIDVHDGHPKRWINWWRRGIVALAKGGRLLRITTDGELWRVRMAHLMKRRLT